MGTGQCRQQDWDDLIELTRDCGGGRWKRAEGKEIVVKGIARKAPCFDVELWRFFGGPVRRYLMRGDG
jgi:hypothetical protein